MPLTGASGRGLSAAEREVVTAVLEAEAHVQTSEYDGMSPAALHALVSEHDVKLHRFSSPLLRKFGEASSEVVSGIGASDPTTRKVWDSYRSFRKRVVKWSQVGLQGYMNARSLRFKYG